MGKVSRAGIITQARMTSTRLPGKVLKKVKNKTLLEYHLERLQKSGLPVIVATTVNKEDDPIISLCETLDIPYFRGDEHNVLERYYLAAKKFELDIIVRVTSDCPLIDGELVGKEVKTYLARNDKNLYRSNCQQRTFPRGFDFEIFSDSLLKDAYANAVDEADREHVTPYIWKNKSGNVVIEAILSDVDMSEARLTVDTSDDFDLIDKLISDYDCDEKTVGEIISLLKSNSSLLKINSHIKQKKFRAHL